MEERDFGWSWMEDEYVPGRPRTEHEFKESFRRAAVARRPWTEEERLATLKIKRQARAILDEDA